MIDLSLHSKKRDPFGTYENQTVERDICENVTEDPEIEEEVIQKKHSNISNKENDEPCCFAEFQFSLASGTTTFNSEKLDEVCN